MKAAEVQIASRLLNLCIHTSLRVPETQRSRAELQISVLKTHGSEFVVIAAHQNSKQEIKCR